jgi:hypothetical protein
LDAWGVWDFILSSPPYSEQLRDPLICNGSGKCVRDDSSRSGCVVDHPYLSKNSLSFNIHINYTPPWFGVKPMDSLTLKLIILGRSNAK